MRKFKVLCNIDMELEIPVIAEDADDAINMVHHKLKLISGPAILEEAENVCFRKSNIAGIMDDEPVAADEPLEETTYKYKGEFMSWDELRGHKQKTIIYYSFDDKYKLEVGRVFDDEGYVSLVAKVDGKEKPILFKMLSQATYEDACLVLDELTRGL